MRSNRPESPSLYAQVRAAMILKGSSLTRWCVDNGTTHQLARYALEHAKRGKSAALREKLLSAAGITVCR